jgi:hypothetical protein
MTTLGGTDKAPTLRWRVDDALRRQLEQSRLGRRVLCTDRHNWLKRFPELVLRCS